MRLPITLLAISVFAVLLPLARAQETIYNVPNGDVLDKGKYYGEFDFAYNGTTGVAGYTPRFVAGVGKRIEVGININGLSTPGEQHFTPTPTIKWKAYDGGDNGWAFMVGDDLFIPAQNKQYDVGTYAYAEFVKTWKTKTRATAGGYYFSKNVAAPAQRGGGQFGIEQPVSSRFTLAADWFTGNQAVGYFTPGLIVKLSSSLTGYLSYQIGNAGVQDGNHQLLVELGWNF